MTSLLRFRARTIAEVKPQQITRRSETAETLMLGDSPLSVVPSSCSDSLLFLKPNGAVIELVLRAPLAIRERLSGAAQTDLLYSGIEVRENGQCKVIRSSQHELDVTLTREGDDASHIVRVSGPSSLCRELDANLYPAQ